MIRIWSRPFAGPAFHRLVALTFLIPFGIGALAAEEGSFRAGAFAIDVTPRTPVSLNGGMSDRISARVRDPLHARCLALDDGRTKLAIVIVDSCMVPETVVEPAKKRITERTGIAPASVTISATHTHTAPTLASTFQSPPNVDYVRELTGKIADGVAEAVKRLEPARFGWGVERHPEDVFHRRWLMKPGTPLTDPFGRPDRCRMNPPSASPELLRPVGVTDPDVTVLSLRRLDGSPLAVMGHYPLHYVGGIPGDEVSADYFGVFSERIRTLAGGDDRFVGMLSNGTSGNINNVDFRKPPRPQPSGEQIRLVGERVAAAAHRALPATGSANVRLAAAATTLKLGVRKPSAEDLERARRILASAPPGKPLDTLERIYARETTLVADYPDDVPVTVQAMRIGDLAIVSIPCEVFVEIGLELKSTPGFKRTLVMPLANGYRGYLPTRANHELGGYETWRAQSSYLAVDAAERIVDAAKELLKRVAAE
jgi:hypothetical protein